MQTRLKPLRNLIRLGLTFTLIFPVEILSGQTQPMPMSLNIVVVDGEGAVNTIRQRASREPQVRVEDENHKPVAGVAIVFTLPTEGATGEFGGGSKNLTVLTDPQGLAKAQGLKMNQVGGKLPIHVTASFRSLAARATITQTIQVPPGAKVSSGGSGKGHGKLIAILAVIGAAGAGGAVYATQRSKSGSTATPPPSGGSTPIGITPGTGSIAPPH
jgi:hypothetical protein